MSTHGSGRRNSGSEYGSFTEDPMTRWVWPNAHQYLAAMPKFIRAFGGAAFARGSAFCSDDYIGAALWLRPNTHPHKEGLAELMQNTVSAEAREAGGAIFKQIEEYRPEESALVLVSRRRRSSASAQRSRRCADATCDRAGRSRANARIPRILQPAEPLSLPASRL